MGCVVRSLETAAEAFLAPRQVSIGVSGSGGISMAVRPHGRMVGGAGHLPLDLAHPRSGAHTRRDCVRQYRNRLHPLTALIGTCAIIEPSRLVHEVSGSVHDGMQRTLLHEPLDGGQYT